MNSKRTWGLVIAFVVLLVPVRADAQEAELPEGVTEEMIEQGGALFTGTAACSTCHGPDATGTGLAPDLTDDTWLHIEGGYQEIVELVLTGVPEPKEAMIPMVPKGGSSISDEEVRAVAAYVWSLSRGG